MLNAMVSPDLACVASVSSRVIARNLEREQKKNPLPLPLHSFFCSRSSFLDEIARNRLLRRLLLIEKAILNRNRQTNMPTKEE